MHNAPSKESEGCRKTSTEVAQMKIDELERLYRELSNKEKRQKILLDFSYSSKNKKGVVDIWIF